VLDDFVEDDNVERGIRERQCLCVRDEEVRHVTAPLGDPCDVDINSDDGGGKVAELADVLAHATADIEDAAVGEGDVFEDEVDTALLAGAPDQAGNAQIDAFTVRGGEPRRVTMRGEIGVARAVRSAIDASAGVRKGGGALWVAV
jgi:hypothetical protein